MEQKIIKQLDGINKSLKWIKETDSMQGAKGELAYQNLVNLRRKLNKKKYALSGNPAAAIYGESQVGKSYLISSLLSEVGSAFEITGQNDTRHNFLEEINPPGGGSESTSLVSRFSVSYQPQNKEFPIEAVLLSLADIILVLCDSFYNDIKASHDLLLKADDINTYIENVKEKRQSIDFQQLYLKEDDVLDLKDYFINHLSKAGEVLTSNFFTEVPLLISKLPPEEWKDVFSLLWNRNDKFTSLFSEIIVEYGKIKFAERVYLPIEAVLVKHGTLLDVERLKGIYGKPNYILSEYKANTTVLIIVNGIENTIELKKSYLCALAAELVFSQPISLLNNKPFLKETDLLDFPGARSRWTLPEKNIATEIIPELLLRGKVAYLFHKYSEYEKINILLFCAKHDDPALKAMPELLNNWICKVVGESSEKRTDFIARSKVPPLFIISTFFNVNLQYNPTQDKPDNDTSFSYRWHQRFESTLKTQLLNTINYDWFDKWTNGEPFKNIFLLRDFEKSESLSNLFKGYNIHKKELTVVIPEAYPEFRDKLKQSFIDFAFVKKHFEQPNLAWDGAATINKDGTELIIEKLTIAANNINNARNEKIANELDIISKDLKILLNEHYNSSDKSELLSKAISNAGQIQFNLDIAFGKNPYFFGAMMKEMMISKSNIYHLYLSKIHDIERRDVVDMDKYSGIRMSVKGLNPNDSFNINLEKLKEHYAKNSLEECQTFFEMEGIDLNELFYGNNDRVKNFSKVLAETLEEYWFNHFIINKQQDFASYFSEVSLQHILDMFGRLYKKLNITLLIADKIRHHVDGYRNIEDVYEMISDISAEIINKFVNSVGLEFYDVSNYQDLKKASENLEGLSWDHQELQFNQNTKEEAAELITQMGNLPELLNINPLPIEAKRLPNYRSYIKWYDLVKAGFIIVSGVPNYDPVANEKLRLIIEEL